MGAFTSTMMAVGVGLQAVNQFSAGKQSRDAYNYNASIFDAQAKSIEGKKVLTEEQHTRMIRQLRGKSISAVASSGYDMSGSALEVLNDTMTQAYLDKNTALYNLEVEKIGASSQASEQRRQGYQSERSSIYSGFGTLLTGGSKWYQQYGGFGKS